MLYSARIAPILLPGGTQLVRSIRLLLPLAVLLLAILACGGSDPITIGEIAPFPGATLAEQGNVLADSIAESIKNGAGREAEQIDVRTYVLPAGTTWEAVRSFYASQSGVGDWEPAEELAEETDYINTAAWSRGGFGSEQVLLVAHSIDPLGGPPYLFLVLFSE